MSPRTLGLLAIVGLVSFDTSVAAAFRGAAPKGTVHEGKVVSVDQHDQGIVIVDAQEKELTFAVDEKCRITVNGEGADLKDLEIGAKVKITTVRRKRAMVAVKIEAKSP